MSPCSEKQGPFTSVGIPSAFYISQRSELLVTQPFNCHFKNLPFGQRSSLWMSRSLPQDYSCLISIGEKSPGAHFIKYSFATLFMEDDRQRNVNRMSRDREEVNGQEEVRLAWNGSTLDKWKTTRYTRYNHCVMPYVYFKIMDFALSDMKRTSPHGPVLPTHDLEIISRCGYYKGFIS